MLLARRRGSVDDSVVLRTCNSGDYVVKNRIWRSQRTRYPTRFLLCLPYCSSLAARLAAEGAGKVTSITRFRECDDLGISPSMQVDQQPILPEHRYTLPGPSILTVSAPHLDAMSSDSRSVLTSP